MKYRQMGRWGVKLSCVGLGSYLTIGFKCDDQTSRATIRAAFDNGINFFDTANAYNRGEAEKSLGKHLAEIPRSAIFLITKVWAPMGGGPNDRGLSAKHIFEQCHASLKRLNMDYVDLYMCHRPDPATPLDETVRAMEDLARQGKILYWGVSEWPAPMLVKANAVAREMGARGIGVDQPRYSLLYRYPETLLFPTLAEEGIGCVCFSPLAHGMLTGKYQPGQPAPPGTRAADPDQNAVMKKLYWNDENMRKGQALAKVAKEMGVTAAQLSLAWCLRRKEVTSVIIGASRVEQVTENLKAAEIEIPAEVLAKMEKLYPTPENIPTV
jgi:aryl-alcohol dehydrogenase-like predicted oxidoreductase